MTVLLQTATILLQFYYVLRLYNNLIDKIYLYVKDLNEPKYQFLTKKCNDAGIENLDDPSAFIECPNTMYYVYNTDDYNPKEREKL